MFHSVFNIAGAPARYLFSLTRLQVLYFAVLYVDLKKKREKKNIIKKPNIVLARESATKQFPVKFAVFTEIAREGSPNARVCVVRILSVWCCGPAEQEALCVAGATLAAAALLPTTKCTLPIPLKILPALDLIAAMCFENSNVSQVALNTR